MSAQAYEAIGREASRLVGPTREMARWMGRLEAATTKVVGGTATGEDRVMTSSLVAAAGALRAAERSLEDAVRAAQRAAREAAAEEARRRRESLRD